MMNQRKRIILGVIITFTMLISCAGHTVLYSFATATDDTVQETENTEAKDDNDSNSNKDPDSNTDNVSGNATDNGTADASVDKAREDAEEARKNLKSAQEILDRLKSAKNDLENYVIEQSIAPGTSVNEGSVINFTVSLGPEPREETPVANAVEAPGENTETASGEGDAEADA